MKEFPIIFSGPMVRAILDGRKTQTRRVVKPQSAIMVHPNGQALSKNGWLPELDNPYGQSGDRLWVRETWGPCEGGFCYRASEHPKAKPDDGRWHPSIHMFREASRLTLEIVSVRVNRLQNISEDDCKAEGLFYNGSLWSYLEKPDEMKSTWSSPHYCFCKLWNSINGKKYPWVTDPWVWVIEFKVWDVPPVAPTP